jgi:hypothetical protein
MWLRERLVLAAGMGNKAGESVWSFLFIANIVAQ